MKSRMIRGKSKWSSYTLGDKIFIITVYAAILLVTFLCLYPLYFTVIASISDPHDVYTGKVSFLPSGFSLTSYELVFQNKGIWRGYANTIFYTVFGTLFNLFLTIPTAYALSKKRMLGRNLFTTLFVITMYFSGGMVPTYILFNNMDLINTRWILVIAGGLSVYNVIITRTYFQNNISESLFEAARIDGASEFRIFFRLVLPLSAPIIAVITLYYAVGHWSGYFNALMYTTDTDLAPLELVLRRILILNENAYEDAMNSGADPEILQNAAMQAQQAVTMKYSLVFIGSLPMLIIYPFIQKFFVKGIMVGSLKG